MKRAQPGVEPSPRPPTPRAARAPVAAGSPRSSRAPEAVPAQVPRIAVRGDALGGQLARAVMRRGRAGAARRPLLARKPTVQIAGAPCGDEQLVEQILRCVGDRVAGPVWFHSEAEARAFVAGSAEGIGIWRGHWVNLAGRGTIVLGEEHAAVRDRFIRRLNIVHRLQEGASERSLQGIDPTGIPDSVNNPGANMAYAAGGHALENFWLRAAQYMARCAVPMIAGLDRLIEFSARPPQDAERPAIPLLERPDQLLEILAAILRTTPRPSGQDADLSAAVAAALAEAWRWADRCGRAGLIAQASAELQAAPPSVAHGPWVKALFDHPQRAEELRECYQGLANSVQALGRLHFDAIASTTERHADRLRVRTPVSERPSGSEPYFEWGPRREVAMLANLAAAMRVDPPPLLVTIGSEHVRNRLGEIKQVLDGRGFVFVGDIDALAELGRQPPPPWQRATSPRGVKKRGTSASASVHRPEGERGVQVQADDRLLAVGVPSTQE